MRNFILRWSGFSRVQELMRSMPDQDGVTFVERSANEFKITSRVHLFPNTKDLMKGTIFVSNHHTGALDFLATFPTLARLAPELKVVVNNQILKIPPLAKISIGVQPLSMNKKNTSAKESMRAHLRSGGNLLLYPAGKVAGREKNIISDFPWRTGLADLIREECTQVVPVFVDAQNSSFFYTIRKLFPKLSMLFLLRALKDNENRLVNVYLGKAILRQELMESKTEQIMLKIREATYSLCPSKEKLV